MARPPIRRRLGARATFGSPRRRLDGSPSTGAASGPSAPGRGDVVAGPAAAPGRARAIPDAATASPDATADVPPAFGSSSGAASASSNSAIEANAARPADAASARADASAAITSRRRPLVIASRASIRKLIREVASRDPNGTTSATRDSPAERMRIAAEVISSSASR